MTTNASHISLNVIFKYLDLMDSTIDECLIIIKFFNVIKRNYILGNDFKIKEEKLIDNKSLKYNEIYSHLSDIYNIQRNKKIFDFISELKEKELTEINFFDASEIIFQKHFHQNLFEGI